MDWFQLYQDMFKTFTKSQETMWKSWESAMGDMQQVQSRMAWEQSVSMWETSTMNMLEAQKRWLMMSISNFSGMMQDETMKETYHKNWEMMVNTWAESQGVLWKNWYMMVKQSYPEGEQKTTPDAFTKMMETWTEQTQKMMKTQMDWASQWATAATETSE